MRLTCLVTTKAIPSVPDGGVYGFLADNELSSTLVVFRKRNTTPLCLMREVLRCYRLKYRKAARGLMKILGNQVMNRLYPVIDQFL